VEREIGDGGGGRHAGRRVGRGIRGGGSGTALRAITSVSCAAAGGERETVGCGRNRGMAGISDLWAGGGNRAGDEADFGSGARG
jgi:hypothetical protein